MMVQALPIVRGLPLLVYRPTVHLHPRRDYAVLMALLMLTSSAVVVLNFVADLVNAAIDPRVTA